MYLEKNIVHNYFEIVTTLVSVSGSLLVGYLVLLRRNKNQSKLLFAHLNFSIALWATANYFSIAVSPERSLIWIRLVLFFAAPQVLFLFLFVHTFPSQRITLPRKTLFLFIAYTALVMCLTLTPLVFNSIEINGNSVTTKAGPAIPFFALLVFGFLLSSILVGINKIRHSTGIQNIQWRFINLGLVSWVLLLALVFILNSFFGISQFVPLSPLFALIFLTSTFYTIVRHQLLDIRIVVTRSIIYGILLSVVSLSFTAITFISGQFFGNTEVSRILIAILVAGLIVFGIDPLKHLLSKITDKIFFKAKIDYAQLLQSLSSVISLELDLQKLLNELKTGLTEGLKIKKTYILLRQGGTERTNCFVSFDNKYGNTSQISIKNSSALTQFIRIHKHPALLELLERKIEDTPEHDKQPLVDPKNEMLWLGAALVAPIFAQGHLVALLVLGPKLSGDTFSNEDLQLIEVLSPQIGSAIQKANLYEEVKQFSEGLKVKVDEATSELRERNTSLQTLQHITKEITRTLDFNQVVQQIADSVSTELGYLGAILVFLDDDGYTVRARAITQTPLTKKALAMLPIDFTKYTSDLRDMASTSVGHQVLRSGQPMMSASFAQVISPPIPKLLAQGIQKLIGIKAVVVLPINSEGRTIGCIEIGVQKPQEQITPQEQETMNALADELGVVSRNIGLFAKIQQTNQQLEVANAHLQQLDQAKSEFVSIASHQLRTPMTGIMGYLSMMTSGDFGKIAPEHKKILQELLSESQRMIRLINQFLNVSKIEAGKFTYAKKSTQLRDLAEQEVQELMHVAKDKGLELKTEFTTQSLPPTVADSDKIQDVMLNLIDNAIKYTAKGSITIGLDMLGRDLHFYVRDTGIGIKPSDAKELFNKFVRGSGIAQIHPDGSGLGLFIAKSIIDAHGGRIWVDSEGEEKGSTFQFTLPVVAQTSNEVVVST